MLSIVRVVVLPRLLDAPLQWGCVNSLQLGLLRSANVFHPQCSTAVAAVRGGSPHSQLQVQEICTESGGRRDAGTRRDSAEHHPESEHDLPPSTVVACVCPRRCHYRRLRLPPVSAAVDAASQPVHSVGGTPMPL